MNDTNNQPGSPSTTPRFNLDLNPQPANPLNTGNGSPQAAPLAQPMPAVAPAPAPAPAPTPPQPPVTQQGPADPYKVIPETTPAIAKTTASSDGKGKKIIVAVIVAILFAAIGYGAYYFLKNSGTDESTNDAEEADSEAPPSIDIPTSEDSEASAKRKELEAVVEELKTIYAESPVTETTDEEIIIEESDISDTLRPPILSIDSSEESPAETEPPSSGGVLR